MKNLSLITFFPILVNFVFAQPLIDWSTYYPPADHDGSSISFDKANNYLYTVGSLDLNSINHVTTTPNCFQDTINGTSDAFLSKFDTSGNRIWATYFGGNGREFYHKITTSLDGSIFISGTTSSNLDLVTIGSAGGQSPNPFNTGVSPYIAKFSSSGNRIWSRYFGDSVATYIYGIACDKNNDVIITSRGANLYQIPASPNSFQQYSLSTNATTIAKFNGTTGELLWWTYYGGENGATVLSLCLDDNANIYLGGFTNSTTNIATPNAFQTSIGSTFSHGFLTKFSPSGERLWGTYFSGTVGSEVTGLVFGQQSANDIARLYVSGITTSDNMATPGAFQPQRNNASDILLAAFNPLDGFPYWVTYFGGTQYDRATSLTLNSDGDILFSGFTQGSQNLSTPCSLDSGNYNTFIAKFSKTGERKWSSYFKVGSGEYSIRNITSGNKKDFYISSQVGQANLGTPGAFQDSFLFSGLITKLQDTVCPNMNIQILLHDDTLSVDPAFRDYTWYKNGVAVNNNDSNFLVFDDVNAQYYVIVQNECGCSYTSNTITPQPNSVNSIGNTGLGLVIYPNPNNGVFQLKGKSKLENHSINYVISDISGRNLINGNFKSKGEIIDQKIDCGDLNPGLYFIELSDPAWRSVLKFVVK